MSKKTTVNKTTITTSTMKKTAAKRTPTGRDLNWVHCIPQPAFAVDAVGRVSAWNGYIEELVGVTEEAALEQQAWKLFFSSHCSTIIDEVLVSATGSRSTYELSAGACTGQRCRWLGEPIMGESGEPSGVLVVVTQEAAARPVAGGAAADGRFKTAVDQGHLAVLLVDKSGQVTYHNEAAGRFLSENRDELAEQGWNTSDPVGHRLDEVCGRDPQLVRALGDAQRRVVQLDLQAGSLTLQVKLAPLLDQAGAYQGLSVVLHDVTELRRNQVERTRYLAAVESSAAALMMLDLDRCVTYVNESMLTLLRENRDVIEAEFPDVDFENLTGVNLDEFQGRSTQLGKVLSDTKKLPKQFDLQIGELLIEVRAAALRDETGKNHGFVVEWFNATERRKAQVTSARLASQLEGSGTGVMMCDLDRRITYLNPRLREVLEPYAQDLRTVFPGFSVDRIVGTCIDDFHKNPARQKDLMSAFGQHPYSSEIEVAGLEFGLNLTALYDHEGKHIGNSVEWVDYNDRAVYRREVVRLIEACKDGRLKERGDLSKLTPQYKLMMDAINELLDVLLRPVQEAAQVVERFSEQDLTVRMNGDYRGDNAIIKNNINQMADVLETALVSVGQSADQVRAASNQISAGSQSLSQATNEQASSLEEISSTVEQVSSMTEQNANNANHAKGLAESARTMADRGKGSMDQLSEAINRIKSSSDQTAKIVKTIDEIAFQTNLLALNAAVEAARAGDAGKGFAVVAEEVRNLAQRSADAAKTTAELIEGSVRNADSGVRLSDDVARQLEEIVTGSTKVNDIVAEIAAASNEQAKGISQINAAIGQINKVTQQNAANSEQSASAAEELAAQAGQLAQMVTRFKVQRRGGSVEPLPERHIAPQAPSVSSQGSSGRGGASLRLAGKRPEAVIPLTEDEMRDF